MRCDRRVVLLGLAVCAGCAAPAPPKAVPPADLSPASLYPLGAGHAWAYDVDSGDGRPVLAVARVASARGASYRVTTGQDAALDYTVHADRIERADGTRLLQAPIAVGASWRAGPDAVATVAATRLVVNTPAGRFADCVRVEEAHGGSGQRVATTYCPGVGPAEVVSEMTVRAQRVRVVARLRGYSLEAPAAAAR